VNLILTGRAASNVFDGVMNLDSGAAQEVILACPTPKYSNLMAQFTFLVDYGLYTL
jgi:hypothetical protein